MAWRRPSSRSSPYSSPSSGSIGDKYYYGIYTSRTPWPLKEGEEQLWNAFVDGDLTAAERLLPCIINSKGISKTVLQPFDKTLLHYACHHGWLGMTSRLIEEYECDTEIREASGWTPLHEASASGHEDVVRYLISDRKCNTLCFSVNGNTPIHLACGSGYLEIVQFLIEHNCDPQCPNFDGDTPLHWACKNGHLMVAECLTPYCNPQCQNSIGDTPLHYACQNGHLNIAMYLTEQNCNPQCQNNSGDTPLHYACQNRHLEVTKFLICQRNCNPQHQNSNGNTPLHLACYRDDILMVKFLLSTGKVDQPCRNREHKAPFHLTLDYEIVKLFAQFSGSSSKHVTGSSSTFNLFKSYCARSPSRNTPLHDACIKNDMETIRFLISGPDCDPECKNVSGATPLHLACWHGNLKAVEILIEHNCDPQCQDSAGNTSLHFACFRGRSSIVMLLLSTGKVDPFCRNGENKTPLHLSLEYEIVKAFIPFIGHTADAQFHDTMNSIIASYCTKSSSGNTVLHDACTRGDMDVVRCLVRGQYCDAYCVNHYNGTTPLHLACENGHVEVVKYLIENSCDVQCQDNYGDTPLHLACRNTYLETAKLLIQRNCNLLVQNKFGDTPLHEACRMNRFEVVKLLLSTGKVDPACRNSLGITPLQLTDRYDIVKLFSHFTQCIRKYSLIPAVKMFILGNASVGKTTLVKVIENKVTSLIGPFVGQWRFVSRVGSQTAGISVMNLQCRRFGNVTIHDLAGQHEYYASHDAMIQNLISASVVLFLVVIKLSDPLTETIQTLQYWLAFVENCCSRVNAMAHILVIGSHADIAIDNGESVAEKWVSIESVCISPKRSIHFAGFVALDCRRLASTGLDSVCELVQTSCSELREMVVQENRIYHHVLYAFICSKLQGYIACTVSNLSHYISNERDALLPSDVHQLNTLLSSLSDSGHLLYLPNKQNIETGWVVINKQALFSEINGTVFAPRNFQKHHNISTSTGVVTKSKIADVFASHDPNMIAGVLTHFEFCQEIKDESTLSLITAAGGEEDSSQPCPDEKYYFFPALVQIDCPKGIWQPAPLQYRCAWCLHCSEVGQYFTPRFLHVLLLQLAFNYALGMDSCQQNEASPVLRRRCAIWKSGIQWFYEDGIEIIIDLVEQNKTLLLLMSSLQGKEMACVKYRSMLIRKILQLKGRFCLNMETEEQVIGPATLSKYPLPNRSSAVLFTLSDIIRVIKEGKDCVIDRTGLHSVVKLEELLYFEPHTCLGGRTQNLLHRGDLGQKVETSFLLSLAEDLSKRAEEHLAQQNSPILLVDKFLRALGVRATVHVVHESWSDLTDLYLHRLMCWRDSDHEGGTYGSLRSTLDKHSIFTGKDILSIVISHDAASETTMLSPLLAQALDHEDCTPLGMEALLDVRTELISLVPLWSQLGLALGLNQSTLDEIKLRYGNTGQSLTETLAAWLQRKDRVTAPTWKALHSALQSHIVSPRQRIVNSHGKGGSLLAESCLDQRERETLLQDVDSTNLDHWSLVNVKTALLRDGSHFSWFDLGLVLGLLYGTLKKIEEEKRGNFDECLRDVLVKWLQQNDRVRDYGVPSWRGLVGALTHPLLDQWGLAKQIAQKQ